MEAIDLPPDRTDGALDGVMGGYVEMSPAELDDELRRLELVRRDTEARMAALMAVADQRGAHLRDGHRTCKDWIRATLNSSGAEAFRWRRRSKLIDRHHVVGHAWLAGRFGREQVDVIAAAAANPRCGPDIGDVVDDLVGQAEQLEYDDFATVVTTWEKLVDADGAFDERREAHARRSATLTADEHGLDLIAYGGDPVTAEEIERIHARAIDREYDRDVAARRERWGDAAELHPLPRTADQRRYDALVAIFRRSVTAPADGKRPLPVVNVHIDVRTLGDRMHAHGLTGENPFGLVDHPDVDGLLAARCHTGNGTVIDPDLALAAAIGGHVRRVVFDSNSVIIDQGERRRLFTGLAREAAMMLATRCTHRGCDIPARWCQVDHVTEHHAGGPTDQRNAAVLCGHHNRHKHRHRWRLRRATNGRLHTIRPDGTTLLAVGQREPTWLDESDPPDASPATQGADPP